MSSKHPARYSPTLRSRHFAQTDIPSLTSEMADYANDGIDAFFGFLRYTRWHDSVSPVVYATAANAAALYASSTVMGMDGSLSSGQLHMAQASDLAAHAEVIRAIHELRFMPDYLAAPSRVDNPVHALIRAMAVFASCSLRLFVSGAPITIPFGSPVIADELDVAMSDAMRRILQMRNAQESQIGGYLSTYIQKVASRRNVKAAPGASSAQAVVDHALARLYGKPVPAPRSRLVATEQLANRRLALQRMSRYHGDRAAVLARALGVTAPGYDRYIIMATDRTRRLWTSASQMEFVFPAEHEALRLSSVSLLFWVTEELGEVADELTALAASHVDTSLAPPAQVDQDPVLGRLFNEWLDVTGCLYIANRR